MNLEKLTSEDLRKFLTMGKTSGKRMAFEFWLKGLRDTVPHTEKLNEGQVYYVARLLTITSLLSADPSTIYFPAFGSLLKIYEELSSNYYNERLEPKLMEIAGCQALLLSGFYRDAAKKKGITGPLQRLGKVFFTGAAVGKRSKVVRKVIEYYEEWQNELCYLEWYLRNERLVLHVT